MGTPVLAMDCRLHRLRITNIMGQIEKQEGDFCSTYSYFRNTLGAVLAVGLADGLGEAPATPAMRPWQE